MDWNAVADLATQYEAAGLGSTRQGSFLKDVSRTQKVTGGGVRWLDSLVANGDPTPWVKMAAELLPLIDTAGADARYIVNIQKRLADGCKLKDWELEVVERVKIRAQAQPVPLTDYQVNILNAVDGVIHNGNHYYWSRRSGFHDKAMRVVSMAKNTQAIHPDDWKWITDNFKGVVRGVETAAGEDGQIRFWFSPVGWKTVLVMGNGYYNRDKRSIVQDCMCEGQIIPIRTDKLRKRKPKEV